MHIYIYTCIHSCILTFIHAYIHAYLHSYIYTHIYIYAYIHTCTCTNTCSWTSSMFDINRLANSFIHECGWDVNMLQFPSCIHIAVTMVHTQDGVVEAFLKDLAASCAPLFATPKTKAEGAGAIYGMAQQVQPSSSSYSSSSFPPPPPPSKKLCIHYFFYYHPAYLSTSIVKVISSPNSRTRYP